LPTFSFPDSATKTKYASIVLSGTEQTIISESGKSILGNEWSEVSEKLLTFEELNQFSGFVLYETSLPEFTRDPNNLVIEKLRDRALIYIDHKLVGVLSRENNIKSLPISAGYGKTLQILVENQGRINFQENFDFKGILGNVSVQTFESPYYEELKHWTTTGFPFDNNDENIEQFIAAQEENYTPSKNGWLKNGPVLFHGTLVISEENERFDTYWDTTGWGKGSLFVNNVNVGRYWPLAGPQMTMYIPKDLLIAGSNSFVLLELQKAAVDLTINFTNEPNFSED